MWKKVEVASILSQCTAVFWSDRRWMMYLRVCTSVVVSENKLIQGSQTCVTPSWQPEGLFLKKKGKETYWQVWEGSLTFPFFPLQFFFFLTFSVFLSDHTPLTSSHLHLREKTSYEKLSYFSDLYVYSSSFLPSSLCHQTLKCQTHDYLPLCLILPSFPSLPSCLSLHPLSHFCLVCLGWCLNQKMMKNLFWF